MHTLSCGATPGHQRTPLRCLSSCKAAETDGIWGHGQGCAILKRLLPSAEGDQGRREPCHSPGQAEWCAVPAKSHRQFKWHPPCSRLWPKCWEHWLQLPKQQLIRRDWFSLAAAGSTSSESSPTRAFSLAQCSRLSWLQSRLVWFLFVLQTCRASYLLSYNSWKRLPDWSSVAGWQAASSTPGKSRLLVQLTQAKPWEGKYQVQRWMQDKDTEYTDTNMLHCNSLGQVYLEHKRNNTEEVNEWFHLCSNKVLFIKMRQAECLAHQLWIKNRMKAIDDRLSEKHRIHTNQK